ncbi:hypothetical protein B0H17DRAFT_1123607 [Mycena rosella]|uniref:Zn(2)-C6 fungal-type domain-containing protein n=1 Tax=Mycena rosella TaxID=1033263 RepID=A0AAD7H2I7_MYCRO|nr:hypothetical protein B0H17DRAFT_1123607 [Mycena rosella]
MLRRSGSTWTIAPIGTKFRQPLTNSPRCIGIQGVWRDAHNTYDFVASDAFPVLHEYASRRAAVLATLRFAFPLYNRQTLMPNNNNMASSNPYQNQSNLAPSAITMRRRSILACSNCRKRKIKCITTEQPPRNPCARCTKKNLPCEYVGAAEPEYHSGERPQTPDADRGNSRTHFASAPRPTPMYSAGRGAAPPLPYTGPPAMVMTPTGWGYVAPSSRRGPNPASVNPGPGSHAHPQYYPPGGAAPQYSGYGNPQYDPQGQCPTNPGSQPPFTQPDARGIDYSEFLNDYDGSQDQSSRFRSPTHMLYYDPNNNIQTPDGAAKVSTGCPGSTLSDRTRWVYDAWQNEAEIRPAAQVTQVSIWQQAPSINGRAQHWTGSGDSADLRTLQRQSTAEFEKSCSIVRRVVEFAVIECLIRSRPHHPADLNLCVHAVSVHAAARTNIASPQRQQPGCDLGRLYRVLARISAARSVRFSSLA